MWRYLMICVVLLMALSSCSTPKDRDAMIVSHLDTPKEKKVEKASFKPYSSCNVEWRSSLWIGVDVQNCFVKWKKLTVVSNDKLHGYYIGIDSGSGMVLQELALQVLDVWDFQNEAQGMQKAVDSLKSSSGTGTLNTCSFVKDYRLSDKKKSIYTIIGNSQEDGSISTCWDYGFVDKNHYRYFIIFKGKQKIIFVNQLKQKRLFDEQSIVIIN